MNFLNQIRTRIHESLLRKQLTALPSNRRSVSLDHAQSIGILFDGTKSEDRETVLGYAKKLKANGKKVKLLCFFNNDLKSENFTFPHFNKKQLDWALRPKLPEADTFIGQPFDLLINLSKKATLPLDYVAALSRARFRVGPSTEKTFCYDLMIEHAEKQNLMSFIQQIEQYLRNMQSSEKVSEAV